MATMSPSSSKRLKSQAPCSHPMFEEEQSHQQSDSVNCSDGSRCGICFSDNVKGIRGKIDCCDHYFCFVCIMEWAKVESRCPLCKRRFKVIRRPPRDGVFATDRIVNVPIRDQAYYLSGNTTVVPSDPYAHAKCSVCNGIADESLLLLCDLCDSASHTYCVGLGTTVPEGDWFCSDCSLSRIEHDHVQVDDGSGAHSVNVELGKISTPKIHSVVKNSDATPPIEVAAPDEIKSRRVEDEETHAHARTLKRCRSVHGYIRSLRENWNALQSGSLSFPSCSVDGNNGRNTSGCSLGQQHSFPSKHGQKCADRMGSRMIPSKDKTLDDVAKAWKMMDRAKSKHLACGGDALMGVDNKGLRQSFSKRHNLALGERRNTASEWHPNCFAINKGPERRFSSGGLPVVSGSWDRPPGLGASSSIEMVAVNGKIESKEGRADGIKRAHSDAKSEIQCLVKINLKLLGKRKLLGAKQN